MGRDTTTNVRDAAVTGLLQAGLFQRAPYIITWAMLSVVPIVLALAGLMSPRGSKRALLLILLVSPLLSVVIYRNAFPYFFPFAAPLLMVTVAYGAQYLQGSLWVKRCVIIMFATGVSQGILTLSEDTYAQHATIAEVHRLFPEPVPYIDDSSIIASFPSVGPFMSTWGMNGYRRAGQPIFGTIVATERPPLLIANKRTLIATMRTANSGHLLAEDDVVIRNSYVHYDGAIWLAGREVTLTQAEQVLEMPFAGQYRVETTAPIQIDGQIVNNGDVVDLTAQTVLNGALSTQVKLIWNTEALPFETDLPTSEIYADFWVFRL